MTLLFPVPSTITPTALPASTLRCAAVGAAHAVAARAARDGDPRQPVAAIECPGRIDADVAGLDDVRAAAGEPDPVEREAPDREAAQRGAAGADVEPRHALARARAVELDERSSRVSRLGRSVDRHRVGDLGQSGRPARSSERRFPGSRRRSTSAPEVRVGVEDRLAQRSGAAVGRGRHGERRRGRAGRPRYSEREENGWKSLHGMVGRAILATPSPRPAEAEG